MKKTKGIVTGYDKICAFCSRPVETEHHLLFGSAMRDLAEEDGIKIPLCNGCHTFNPVAQRIHDNTAAEHLSKMAGQLAWEKQWYKERVTGMSEGCDPAREAFRTRYRISYL